MTTTVLETWEPSPGNPLSSRTMNWASDMRVEQIASDGLGTTAIGGRVPNMGLMVRRVAPTIAFNAVGADHLLESPSSTTRLVRLRVLAPASRSLVNPIVGLVDGTLPSEAILLRASTPPSLGVLFSSATTGTARADDVIELPMSRLALSGRCDNVCTLGSSISNPVAVGPTHRLGAIPFDPADAGLQPPTSFESIAFSGVPSFDGNAPTRLVTDENAFVYTVGQKPLGVLHIERRTLSNFAFVTAFTSNGPLTAVDAIRSPFNDTVLVLATVEGPGITISGQSIPYTAAPATMGNVVLLRLGIGMQPLSVTTWDLPGDQRAVGFAHSMNDGILPEHRVVIIGNEGTDAFIWSVLHPP